ncbi:hypothetical protein FACS1894110_10040 [Spirochaetia bacterium]|nr:hypothetical protein FACS1894110_10040 [Spirochaetia bacterium]
MSDKTGGMVFPHGHSLSFDGNGQEKWEGGMTLRDAFAIAALNSITNAHGKITGWSDNIRQVVEWHSALAYHYADAMIDERNKEEQ